MNPPSQLMRTRCSPELPGIPFEPAPRGILHVDPAQQPEQLDALSSAQRIRGKTGSCGSEDQASWSPSNILRDVLTLEVTCVFVCQDVLTPVYLPTILNVCFSKRLKIKNTNNVSRKSLCLCLSSSSCPSYVPSLRLRPSWNLQRAVPSRNRSVHVPEVGVRPTLRHVCQGIPGRVPGL